MRPRRGPNGTIFCNGIVWQALIHSSSRCGHQSATCTTHASGTTCINARHCWHLLPSPFKLR